MQDKIIISNPSQDRSTPLKLSGDRSVTSTETPALFENPSEIAEAEKLQKQINQFTQSALGEALFLGRKLNSFKKRLLSKYGKKDGTQKYHRWVKELTNFFSISANLAKVSVALADFYFSLDSKTRRLIRSHTKNWSISALKELKTVPESHLVALIKAGRQTVASIKGFIKSLLPKSYLISGRPFSPNEDFELLTLKYNLSEEALATIIEQAQVYAAQREDATLLTDDILEALTALGYDPAVILPPPPKMSKQLAQALAQVDQAEKVAQDAITKWHSAIATSQELSLQLKREKTKSAETIARLQTVHEKTIAQLQAVTEKTIAQLQAENQQLKLQLAQSQTAAPEPVPAITSINIPNPDAQTQVPPQTTARVNGDPHQASRESSIDIIDAQPETLAESALASPNQVTLNSTLWADVDANTLPVGEATGSKLDPAKSFIKGAVVGILNKSRKKCINYGKMVSVSGKKVSVSLFNGASKLFELQELCILEVPSTYKGFA
ncbi:hypothetical protein PCC7424_5475 (plasmid) [Gloeothece citriformis PCC 7424]|uniref:Uncharacterized protein n=1 Tax=Gloeothece citriformis (strain PCC 7424) TaxID=65393 RepID=B7KMM4_GLOC7|nr:hypothetical protein [Gloeothece citriformis]ACK74046.1 hypothetical protein PCC7424_5475 [Gloeothece citriformis PCC 7424]